MWWIYLIVICLVCVAAVAGFFVGNYITNKKRDEIMKNLLPTEQINIDVPTGSPVTETVLPNPNVELENFTLEEKKVDKKLNLNPFNSSHEDDDFSLNDELNDDYVDEKFNEYEEFLRKNTNYFDNDDIEGFDDIDEMDEVSSFDYSTLAGKTDEEIADALKNLSPKAQEIILTEILSRRKYDEE